MKVLIIDHIDAIFHRKLESYQFECMDGTTWSEEKILNNIHEFHGVCIRSRIALNAAFFERATQLKFVARAGAGMESIDTGAAVRKNIICFNSPEGNSNAVGEHALSMLLALFNKINSADEEVRSGLWNREGNRGVELEGKTVGIIGYGNMGNSFAEKLRGFECKVLVYDKYKSDFGNDFITECNMNQIFDEADVISLHIPLTKETAYLIDEAFIHKFKKPIYVINTARGKCLRTDSVVAAMKEEKILGVCLDVYEYEEVSFEKFSLDQLNENPSWQYLIQSDRTVLTPHVAGWTKESYKKIAEVLADKIIRVFGRK